LTPIAAILSSAGALRAHAAGNRVKILYVVTDQDANEFAKARAAGVNEILSKPFHRVQLEAKVLGFLAKPRDLDVDLAAHRPLMRSGQPASIHAFRAVIEA
jgi:PleD family two-component response regulator